MSLAYAHLNLPSPDVDAATEEVRAALRLQPDWHYQTMMRAAALPGGGSARERQDLGWGTIRIYGFGACQPCG